MPDAPAGGRSVGRSAGDSASRVAGRVAVVTGGASGLGLACAHALAAEGAAVVVADIDEEAGRRAAESLGAPAWAPATDGAGGASVGCPFRTGRQTNRRLD